MSRRPGDPSGSASAPERGPGRAHGEPQRARVVEATGGGVVVRLSAGTLAFVPVGELPRGRRADPAALVGADVAVVALDRSTDGRPGARHEAPASIRLASLAQLEAARREGRRVRALVTGVGAGGLTCEALGMPGLVSLDGLPARAQAEPEGLVGRRLRVHVGALSGGRALLTPRAPGARGRPPRVGRRVRATVVRIDRDGVSVVLRGRARQVGLVPRDELAWTRVRFAADAVRLGQRLRLRVLELRDAAGGRPQVVLSARALRRNPWPGIARRLTPGRVVDATVVELAPFGAFVTVAGETAAVALLADAAGLHDGDRVRVVVERVDVAAGRLWVARTDRATSR